ncbi:hypothetical protein BDY21DRAFT_329742 [Lineolata rhizophorae]|uniref:Actin-like ATPase domain-containing protein n=1 Tax=Lineolata rhizophorae TaxID=578093 RepID=A0A6A6PCX3_9PEZI|nr:hypothetical protein BDY21DRAFT_329742 [Lineolata rhizophorae]
MAVPVNRVVIAIDYGTTYTGIAFFPMTVNTVRLLVDEIRFVGSWPSAAAGNGRSNLNESKEEFKVPSDISYAAAKNAAKQWGFDICPGSPVVRHAKLEFEPQQRLEELRMILTVLEGTKNLDLQAIRNAQDGIVAFPARDATQVVADYLLRVREHAAEQAKQWFQATVPIDLVITVPTVWNDTGKDRTLHAIHKAGFNETHFPTLRKTYIITEPEAASYYILKSMHQKRNRDVKVGDCFVVCDAGGGTVDLISYRVKQLEPTFEIEEVGFATGDRCGASYIDLDFQRWLRQKIGKENYDMLLDGLPDNDAGSYSVVGPKMQGILRYFEENIKTGFGKRDQPTKYFLPFPSELDIDDDREKDIQDGEILMTLNELKTIFKPTIQRTRALIAGQVNQVELRGYLVRSIFLCGGFARNEHLFTEVGNYARIKNIGLERGSEPWTAVARGAVAKGIDVADGLASIKRCPKHYGLSTCQLFAPHRHSEQDRYIDPFDGQHKAKDQITWLIHKGDPLFSNKSRTSSVWFRKKFDIGEVRVFQTIFVATTEEQAPQSLSRFHEHTGAITKLDCDLRNVPDVLLDRTKAGARGTPYFSANLRLDIRVDTSSVQIQLFFGNDEILAKTMSL